MSAEATAASQRSTNAPVAVVPTATPYVPGAAGAIV
jgi:hypothetical protein